MCLFYLSLQKKLKLMDKIFYFPSLVYDSSLVVHLTSVALDLENKYTIPCYIYF
jgi:hypothetical protein